MRMKKAKPKPHDLLISSKSYDSAPKISYLIPSFIILSLHNLLVLFRVRQRGPWRIRFGRPHAIVRNPPSLHPKA